MHFYKSICICLTNFTPIKYNTWFIPCANDQSYQRTSSCLNLSDSIIKNNKMNLRAEGDTYFCDQEDNFNEWMLNTSKTIIGNYWTNTENSFDSNLLLIKVTFSNYINDDNIIKFFIRILTMNFVVFNILWKLCNTLRIRAIYQIYSGVGRFYVIII